MFVLCPHCQFLVAVDPVTGQPPARCPRCDGTMAPPVAEAAAPPTETATTPSRDDDLADVVPASDPEPGTVQPEPRTQPAAQIDGSIVAVPAVAMADDVPAPAAEPAPASAPAPAATRTRAPSFVRAPMADAAPRRTLRHWRMPLAIAALALLLALQMLLADRVQLASDARWRPALDLMCATLRCALPPWREPAAFTLVDRDVRPDPGTPGVLHVRARFRNDARWPQPWPRVQLTLSDVDGRVAGARLFAPREYAAATVTRNPIASGQVADIVMDVIEPAPDVVAFTFDFR